MLGSATILTTASTILRLTAVVAWAYPTVPLSLQSATGDVMRKIEKIDVAGGETN